MREEDAWRRRQVRLQADPEEMSEKPSSSTLKNAVVPAAVVLGTVVLAILSILLLYHPLDLTGWSASPNTNYLVSLLVPAALALVVYWLERALRVARQKARRKAESQAKPRIAWPRWT